MYSHYPPRDRARLKGLHAFIWLLVAGVGFTIALDPGWTAIATASWVITSSGVILGISGMISGVATLIGRYRLEWPFASFAFIGAVPYVVTRWWLVFTDILPLTPATVTHLILTAILLSYPLSRSVACLAHSNHLRAERKLLGSITTGDVKVQITRRDQGE